MGGFLMFAGLIALGVALFTLVNGSLTSLRLDSRKKGAAVLAAGIVAMVAGSSMAGSPEPDRETTTFAIVTSTEVSTTTTLLTPPTTLVATTAGRAATTLRSVAATTRPRVQTQPVAETTLPPIAPFVPTTPQTEPPAPDPTQPQGNCDPSYPDFCIAPPPPDLDCADIGRSMTVLQPDPHRFDGLAGSNDPNEPDGMGCESYN